jgi:hypothetical protein
MRCEHNNAAFACDTTRGLSKREYFAVAAITAIRLEQRGEPDEKVAAMAVRLADALIKALNEIEVNG